MMNKRAKLVRAVALILLLSVISLPIITLFVRADPGWLAGWDKRVEIILDSGDVDDDQTNFPHLIHISASCGINNEDLTFIFDEVGANSLKIAVTTSDGTTECYVEIEDWDSGSEEAWFYTGLPSITSGTDTHIFLYFDNDHADNNAYVGIPNSVPAENVWDSNFKLVSHMRDDPDTSHVRDSTTEDNDGTKIGANEPIVTTAGMIDDAQDFDGDNDAITVLDDASIDASTLTLEVWIDIQEAGTYVMILDKADAASFSGFLLGRHSNNSLLFQAGDGAEWGALDLWTTTTYTDGWYHVVATNDGTDAFIYVNGALAADGTGDGITIQPNNNKLTIGAFAEGGSLWFNGIIDEPRFSNTDRTPAWIKASYESGRDHLNDFGSEETLVTVTDTDTHTTTSCTSTTTTTCDTTSTISTDYTTTTDTISITTTTSLTTATATSCETACETCTLDTTTITITLTTTDCSTSCMTAYVTSTNTTFVGTQTVSDISTSTSYTATETIQTTTSIEGIVPGGWNIVMVPLVGGVGLLVLFAFTRRRRR